MRSSSKRVITAAVSLAAVVMILSVFTVFVYSGKRGQSVFSGDEYQTETSREEIASDSVSDVFSQDEISSEEDVSSVEEVTSEPAKKLTTDMKKNKNEYIINPDYKSEFYMVVYKQSQSIMVYQKDKKGGYTVKFMNMRCSTGSLAVTDSDDGVYRIEKKEQWSQLPDGTFAQYASLIDSDKGLFLSSAPYTAKKPNTLIEVEYDKLGTPSSQSGIYICVRDAHWVDLNMPVGTQISIVEAAGPEPRAMTNRKKDKKYNGWEPTDKWSKNNPYFIKATTTSSNTAASTTDSTPSSSDQTEGTSSAHDD